MPRPIVTGGEPGQLAPRIPLEYPMATVDSPDAYYTGARAQLDGQTINVMDRDFQIIGSYLLDEAPTFTGDAEQTIVGMTDDQPIVLRRSNGCGCQGTLKVLKNQEAGSDA